MSERIINLKFQLFDSFVNSHQQTAHKYQSISPSKSIEVAKKRLKFFTKDKNPTLQLRLNQTALDQANIKNQNNFDDHQNFIVQKQMKSLTDNKPIIKVQYKNQKKVIVKKIRSNEFIFKDEIKSHLSNSGIKASTFQQKLNKINSNPQKNYNIFNLIQQQKTFLLNKKNQKLKQKIEEQDKKQSIFEMYPKAGPLNFKQLNCIKKYKNRESPILTVKNHVFQVYFSKNVQNNILNLSPQVGNKPNKTTNKFTTYNHQKSKSFYQISALQKRQSNFYPLKPQLSNLSTSQMRKTEIMNKIMVPCQISPVQFSKRISTSAANKSAKTKRLIRSQFNIQEYDLDNLLNRKYKAQNMDDNGQTHRQRHRQIQRQIHTSYTGRHRNQRDQIQQKMLIDAWDSNQNVIDDL